VLTCKLSSQRRIQFRLLAQSLLKRYEGETAEMANVTSGKLGAVLSRPSVLRWLYKALLYEPVATDWNAIGVVGYEDS
jgi:hypothetical protein